MKWTQTSDLLKFLTKKWENGDWLRMQLAPDMYEFPLKLPLRSPTSSEVTERFTEVKNWIASLKKIPYITVHLHTVRHRVFGQQTMPESLSIENVESIICWLEKTNEWHEFSHIILSTMVEQPILLEWLKQSPLVALKYYNVWPQLLSFIRWLQHNPRPNIYLRQIDLPGIDTKFIENHRAILIELLDRVLPPEQVNPNAKGIQQFALRYGFLEKPIRIRFRFLDSNISTIQPFPMADLSLEIAHFADLPMSCLNILIVENEITYLSLPHLPNTIAIFGSGYGWDAWAILHWLHTCRIIYWGDLDTHGFSILSQFRQYFPRTESILMDSDTLLNCAHFWGQEPSPTRANLSNLTPEEQMVYQGLQQDEWGTRVRLEQERIPYPVLYQCLKQIFPSD